MIIPCRLVSFMGDWEWVSAQCDHWGVGFDQKTVMLPKATGTVGMTQLPEEENVNLTQSSTTKMLRVNTKLGGEKWVFQSVFQFRAAQLIKIVS